MNSEELRDIHPPLLLPEAPDYTIPIVGLICLLLILALLYWFFRLRKKHAILPFSHDIALADLMRARSLMTPEQALEYAATLSDILRRYIEKRFSIRTTRQTTKEFFASLIGNLDKGARVLENHHDDLENCLNQCDMAKFARCTPDRTSMENMENAVRAFIESTSASNNVGGK